MAIVQPLTTNVTKSLLAFDFPLAIRQRPVTEWPKLLPTIFLKTKRQTPVYVRSGSFQKKEGAEKNELNVKNLFS